MLRPNESPMLPILAAILLLSVPVLAEAQGGETGEANGLPRQIQFAGQLPATGLQSVSFALYATQDDTSPEWLETQNVSLDAEGRFTVSFGAASPDGLPQYLFTDNSARWLGVRLNHDGAEEQPRVLLMSVPYALKAGDAETLGGKPASAFVLTAGAPGSRENAADGLSSASAGDNPPTSALQTAGKIPKFDNSPPALIDSIITESAGGNIGISTGSPTDKLHVVGGDLRVEHSDHLYFETNVTASNKQQGLAMHVNGLSRGGFTWEDGTRGDKMAFNSAGSLEFQEAGTARMNIIQGGNVGIGTTSPGQKLEVAGNVKITGTGNGVVFPDGSTQTTSARTRGITFVAGCNWCGTLADNYDQPQIYYNVIGAMTINSITCFSDTGSPVVNIAINGGAGIVSGNLTCSTGGATSTSISPNTLNLNERLDFVMVSAGGSAHRVTVTIKTSVN